MTETIQKPAVNSKRKLAVLDLFSGIGGFSLGLERATNDGKYTGFETVAFCEIEAFPRKVLAKHWPNVPCYDDVRTLTAERLAADGIAVDVICGGFPCQDISTAGKGAGLAGERSGLWSEIARLVSELAPRFVFVENVSALLSRGLGDVLGDLASIGYDAEWHCIPAATVGAPHRRDRIWILAHPRDDGHRSNDRSATHSSAARQGEGEQEERKWFRSFSGRGGEVVADSLRWGRQGPWQSVQSSHPAAIVQRQAVDAFHGCVAGQWAVEPNVGRVANGVPDRSHRLKALGNAVVPQIPELIGNAILQAMNE